MEKPTPNRKTASFRLFACMLAWSGQVLRQARDRDGDGANRRRLHQILDQVQVVYVAGNGHVSYCIIALTREGSEYHIKFYVGKRAITSLQYRPCINTCTAAFLPHRTSQIVHVLFL
jgi:hypothetical protein